MAEYIDRYKLAKNLCEVICGRDAVLCIAEPKDCRQKEMMAVFDTPATDVSPEVHAEIQNIRPLRIRDRFGCCSLCGKTVYYKSKYCPNCGAKINKEAPDGLDTP